MWAIVVVEEVFEKLVDVGERHGSPLVPNIRGNGHDHLETLLVLGAECVRSVFFAQTISDVVHFIQVGDG